MPLSSRTIVPLPRTESSGVADSVIDAGYVIEMSVYFVEEKR